MIIYLLEIFNVNRKNMGVNKNLDIFMIENSIYI